MALLNTPDGGANVPLASRTLVGRSAECGLRLDDPHVSSVHATIAWTGLRWEIRDLGSRNGTFLNGAKLDAGRPVHLQPGTLVAFGDPSRTFTLVDDSPPALLAVESITGTIRTSPVGGGILVLPSDTHPEVSVYEDRDGTWRLETMEGTTETLADQQYVQAGGSQWLLHLPAVNEGTPIIRISISLESVSFRFAVRRDEERVKITILHRGAEIPLEPREHGYVLLTLARARAKDAEHLPEDQRGWRDREHLERMLGMEANALNVAIHRARQQISAAGIIGAARIVEVKRGQRRFGTEQFTIVPLEEGTD